MPRHHLRALRAPRTHILPSLTVAVCFTAFLACSDDERARPAADASDADASDAAQDSDAPDAPGDDETTAPDLVDPTAAPPVDPTVATTVWDAAAFLVSGESPRQTGVAEGVIDPVHLAVLTGEVRDREGEPLADVKVDVVGHPELGSTLTRADGSYALAVNGGRRLVVRLTLQGHVPVSRVVEPGWQRYAPIETIVLTARAPVAATASFAADADRDPPLVARGPETSDEDGARQATLLVPDDTTATMTLPDGREVPLTSGAIRITEITVGADGPAAMPGTLPPESGYTYAFEVAIDEAEAEGATEVSFSTPLPFYERCFLGFPAGTPVPLGYFDEARGAWVAADSGRVVTIVEIADGLARVDTDGDDLADDQGLSEGERQRLAELYAVGDRLMRVELPHLTTWDANWGVTVGDGANFASVIVASGHPKFDPKKLRGFGAIDPERQTVDEDVPLVGVPFGLHYTSARAPGYAPARIARVALDSPLPDTAAGDLLRVEVEVLVAGRRLTRTLYRPGTEPRGEATFSAGQLVEIPWDGRDAFGRALEGGQAARVRIGHAYRAVYGTTTRFGYTQGAAITSDRPARDQLTLWSERDITLGGMGTHAAALGGFTPTLHHVFDPVSATLYQGDGRVRSAAANAPTIETVARNLAMPMRIMPEPDGALTVVGYAGTVPWIRIAPDGTQSELVQTLGGTPVSNPTGRWLLGTEGAEGTLVQFHAPPTANGGKVARAPDGSYIFVFYCQVRRVARDAEGAWRVQSVFGSGDCATSIADGAPQDEVSLGPLQALWPHPDGGLYVVAQASQEIWRVQSDGRVRRIVSSLMPFGYLTDLVLDPRGDLIARSQTSAWRISPQGVVTLLADSNLGPAEAVAYGAHGLAVGPDASLYFGLGNTMVARLAPDGVLTTYVGTWGGARFDYGDGGPARAAGLSGNFGLAVDAGGRLLITGGLAAVRRVTTGLPTYQGPDATYRIGSEDASEVFEFDAQGRHLGTRDALTGVTLWTFGYDANGRLVSVTDREGDITRIERDAAGVAEAIVGPDGDRTTLAIGADGMLAEVTNPAGEVVRLDYAEGGLLTAVTGARGNRFGFEYDADGRVIRASDPPDPDGVSGAITLARTPTPNGVTVTTTSALGLVTTHMLERLAEGPATGALRRTTTGPDGTSSSVLIEDDGTTTITSADGTVTAITEGADPRFGVLSPFVARFSVDPPGDTPPHVVLGTRTIEGQGDPPNPTDPFDFTTLTHITRETRGTEADLADDRVLTTVYTRATRTSVTTGAASNTRTSTTTRNGLGRIASMQIGDDLPQVMTYDAAGRLAGITRGARAATATYDVRGLISAATDAAGFSATLTYDAARRLTEVAYDAAVGGTFGIGYDEGGAPIAITTAAGHVHRSPLRPTEQIAQTLPPSLGASPASEPTRFTYDADRRLVGSDGPGDDDVDYVHDAFGRLASVEAGGLATPIAYIYDGAGRVAAVEGDGVRLDLTWDGALRLGETYSGAFAGAVTRNWDQDHRVSSIGISGASGLFAYALSYDPDSLLTGLEGDLAAAITRDPATGRITDVEAGGLSETLEHDGFGERGAQRLSFARSILYAVDETRDALGRVVERAESFGGDAVRATFAYDARGRLVSWDPDGPGGVAAVTYTWDTSGNRTFGSGTSIDAQDRLLARPGVTYTWSPAGRLASITDAAGATTFAYDALGRLAGAGLPSGPVTYLHDGLGRRVSRSAGADTRRWLYDPQGRLVAELDADGALVLGFAYLQGATTPFLMRKGEALYRVVSDVVGSVRLIVDVDSGQIAQRLDYDPFGVVLADSSPGFQPLGFAGGLYDRATGLLRFGARDYDPRVGRFTAKDPIGFAGGEQSLYGYCGGDPVNRADPSGLGPRAWRTPDQAIDPYRHNHHWWLDHYTGAINFNIAGGLGIFGKWGIGGGFGGAFYFDTAGSIGLAPVFDVGGATGVDAPGPNFGGSLSFGKADTNFSGHGRIRQINAGSPTLGPTMNVAASFSPDGATWTGVSAGFGVDLAPDTAVSYNDHQTMTLTPSAIGYDAAYAAGHDASSAVGRAAAEAAAAVSH